VLALLARAIADFPVDPQLKGSRNARFFRLICSLVCQDFEVSAIEAVAMGWWDHFYRLGSCTSKPKPSVVKSQVRSCRRAYADGRIGPGNPHWSGMASVRVSDGRRARLCHPSINKGITTTARRATRAAGLTAQERAFLECLLVIGIYEHEKTENPVPENLAREYPHAYMCTNEQLYWLLVMNHGMRLTAIQLARLKYKFWVRAAKGGGVKRPTRMEVAEELLCGFRDQTGESATIVDPRGPLLAALLADDVGP
jgi:hypothetical protein